MPHTSSKKKVKKAKLAKKFGYPVGEKYFDSLSLALLSIVLVLTIFMLGGGLYSLVEKPPLLISYWGRNVFYVPRDLTSQIVLEGLFSTIFLCMGFGGVYLTYRGVRSGSHRLASITFFVGLVMLVIGVLGMHTLLYLKAPTL